MDKSFVIKGNICQTKTSNALDLHENAFVVCVDGIFGKVGSFEEGYEFDAVVMDDTVLPHPQSLNLAERMERAVYLGLDAINIDAKFVAGRKIL